MTSYPPLLIRLKRHADSSASITLTRADGTVTWQRQKGALGLVFPPHDLTHYAIETILGFRHAFYGLVADGWDITDFAAPWPRGPVPGEGREVELWVGLFDGLRRDKDAMSAAELNAEARALLAGSKFQGVVSLRTLTDSDVARVRARRNDLLEQWGALESGEALELRFER